MRKLIILKHKKPLYKRGIMHGKLSVANRYRVSQMPSKTNTLCSYAHYKSRGVLPEALCTRVMFSPEWPDYMYGLRLL